ncbi:MAG: pyroglutamyl-peptidase I [Candidatus Heimdallarchaeota archaeon]
MQRVILTGFEPFGGDKLNPALEIITDLSKEQLPGCELLTIKLPVVFGKAIEILEQAIAKAKPALILSIGQAGGRNTIAVEKIGININDARIADNEGNKPKDELIVKDGPAAYFTTIDCRRTVTAITRAGIPAILSYSASTYVCNNLIYGTLHYITTHQLPSKYGFLHVPYLPEQVAKKEKALPSMSLAMMKKAVKIALEVNL